ncbi:7450_t:CDS:2, partial [Racocetra fulgida]
MERKRGDKISFYRQKRNLLKNYLENGTITARKYLGLKKDLLDEIKESLRAEMVKDTSDQDESLRAE